MTRQNGILGLIVFFTILVLGGLMWSTGLWRPDGEGPLPEIEIGKPVTSQNQIQETEDPVHGAGGDQAAPADPSGGQKIFAAILKDLDECLALRSATLREQLPVQIKTLIDHFATDFGPPTLHQDRWMSWHLKSRDGREHELRLEVEQSAKGLRRQLKSFTLDREGNPIPVDLDLAQSENPTDEMIDELLKEGDVFSKERAAVVQFAGGRVLNYIESDDEILSEIDVHQKDVDFKCSNLKIRETCSCAREAASLPEEGAPRVGVPGGRWKMQEDQD